MAGSLKTFGIIGLGRMGYRTILAARDQGLNLVSALDIADQPWALSQEPSLRKVEAKTLGDFFQRQPDIVSITTTADVHFDMFKAAVEAGIKTILLEKPLACSLDQAVKMGELAKKNNVHALVNHNHRAWHVMRGIRAYDGTAGFGRLKAFLITQGAGGLGNLGTHYFDLANWFFNSTPTSIVALGTKPESSNPRGTQFEDIGGTVLVSYPEERRLVLEIGDDIGVTGGFELRFERGRIVMPLLSEAPRLFTRKKNVRDLPKHFYGAELEEIRFEDFEQADIIRNTSRILGDLVARESRFGATILEASRALECMVASRLSIQQNAIVPLPIPKSDRARIYNLA